MFEDLILSRLFNLSFTLPYFFYLFRPVTYVWVNAYATDGHSSHLKVFSIQVGIFYQGWIIGGFFLFKSFPTKYMTKY